MFVINLSEVKTEKAVLVGLVYGRQSEEKLIEYLDELEFLTNTAGAEVSKRFIQKLSHPDKRSFVGSGKLQEIKEFIELHEIDMIIFDDEISPSQQNNIEKELKIKVLDRAHLILDIFAGRAQTAQAKAQVDLAQMQYMLPRLRGMWTHLERQKGGIGMRGPGETEIETDRRIIRDKISKLKKELEKIDKQNFTRRKTRGELIQVALVGYTNVGKSTLMNRISKSEVLAEDKLFATLDTTVRKVVFETTPFLLSDTVGFIRKLPTHLIESFKSTLDEVREADLLLHVVDVAHPQFIDHMDSVNATLDELGALEKPTIMVFNKIDLYKETQFDKYLEEHVKQELMNDMMNGWLSKTNDNAVFVSAITKENIDVLRQKLIEGVKAQYKVRYPYRTQFY